MQTKLLTLLLIAALFCQCKKDHTAPKKDKPDTPQWEKLPFPDSSAITLLFKNGNTLFVGTEGVNDGTGYTHSLYTSSDTGHTWQISDNGLMHYNIQTMVGYGNAQGYKLLMAGGYGNNGLFTSVDSGKHWTQLTTFPPGAEKLLLLQKGMPGQAGGSIGDIFLTPGDGGIYHSADFGKTWHSLTGGLEHDMIWYPQSPAQVQAGYGNLLVVSQGGLLLSQDDGASWTHVGKGLKSFVNKLYYNQEAKMLFAATDVYGIYQSSPGSDDWQPANNGFPIDTTGSTQVWDFAQWNNSLFAASDLGVYRSDDNGTSWKPFNEGLKNIPIRHLLVIGNILYASRKVKGAAGGPYGNRLYKYELQQ